LNKSFPMRFTLLFATIIVNGVLAMAQDPFLNSKFLGVINCGSPDSVYSATTVFDARSTSLNITKIDDLCSIVINPTSQDPIPEGSMTVIGLFGSCSIGTEHGDQLLLTSCPVKVMKEIKMLTCVCYPGRYAKIEVWDKAE